MHQKLKACYPALGGVLGPGAFLGSGLRAWLGVVRVEGWVRTQTLAPLDPTSSLYSQCAESPHQSPRPFSCFAA